MNTKYNNIDTVIQDYVLGRLNDAKATEFEEFFLSNHEVAEQVESAQLMHAGLQELEKRSRQSSINYSKAEAKNRQNTILKSEKSLFEKLLGLLTIPVPAFAMIAMVAVLSPMALQSLNGDNSNSNISLVNFSTQTTRSTNEVISIDLSNRNGDSALLIKLKSVEFPNFKLKLIPIGELNPVWESEPFKPSALRDKLVTLPSGSLGKVQVEVVGIDDTLNETIVEFCHYSENCK